ncbi:MAG: HipA domain-containing protein [Aquabacterium sp.]
MPPGSRGTSRFVQINELIQQLKDGPRTAKALTEALSISQPTLSRTIHEAADLVTLFRLKGQRTPYYGALRPLPGGLNPRQTIYRVSQTGHLQPFGEVCFLRGGGTLEQADARTSFYEGLPPYMAFAAPSGFLGRQAARDMAAADAHVPESLRDWNDDHRITWLFTRSLNLPGNLIYGDASLQREMALRKAAPTPEGDKLAHYTVMANQLKDAPHGSSAGGEQPKFLSLSEELGHVIVKFAKRGTRMADLLPLEHLALQCLQDIGVPASHTRICHTDEHVFLEVQRFDRIGAHGRVGMLSAGAIDDEFFGARDTWSDFAARCLAAKYLRRDHALHIHVMAAFSELIGNTDRHFENISVLLDDDGEYARVAPAYDILPMRYAPIGGGVDPDLTPITPRLGSIGAKPDVWLKASRAALQFWDAVAQGRVACPIATGLGELARVNRAVVEDFVGPLVPAVSN